MAMITADPKDVPQVASFTFTPEYMAKVQELIAHYPPGRQASMRSSPSPGMPA